MRAGVCTIALKDRSVDEAIDAAAAAGAECIELWGRAPHLPALGDLVAFERIRRRIRDAGLQLAALGSYYRPDVTYDDSGRPIAAPPESPEAAPGAVLEAAVRLQAPLIRIWPGNRSFADYTESERVVVMRQIIEFANRAGEEGHRVAVERHNGTLTDAWDTTELVIREIRDRVAEPDLFGLCYQVPYPVPAEELRENYARDFASLMPLSIHAHLQNYIVPVQAPADHRYPRGLLSDGVVDYARLAAAARESGYDGAAMIEFIATERGNRSAEAALAADVAFVASL